jgi:hypothetical protein
MCLVHFPRDLATLNCPCEKTIHYFRCEGNHPAGGVRDAKSRSFPFVEDGRLFEQLRGSDVKCFLHAKMLPSP